MEHISMESLIFHKGPADQFHAPGRLINGSIHRNGVVAKNDIGGQFVCTGNQKKQPEKTK